MRQVEARSNLLSINDSKQLTTLPPRFICENQSSSAAPQAQSEAHFANCGMHPLFMHVQQASKAEPGVADGKGAGGQDASVWGSEPGGAELPMGGAEPPDGTKAGGTPVLAGPEAAGVDEGLELLAGAPESGADPPPAPSPAWRPPHAQANANKRNRIGDTPAVRVGMVHLRLLNAGTRRQQKDR